MEQRQLSEHDKKFVYKYIIEMNEMSEGYIGLDVDIDKNDDIYNCIFNDCKTVGDLLDLFRHVKNLDLVDTRLNNWKILEILLGTISCKDDVRFISIQ